MSVLTPVHSRVQSWSVVVIACLALAWVSSACAAEDAVRRFDIPSGDALHTLKQFTAQSGAQVLYAADEVEGVKTKATQGQFTPRRALETLLNGTGLRVDSSARSS